MRETIEAPANVRGLFVNRALGMLVGEKAVSLRFNGSVNSSLIMEIFIIIMEIIHLSWKFLVSLWKF